MTSPAAAQAGGTAGNPRQRARAACVLRGLAGFAGTRGIPGSREFLLDYDVIEAFCVSGLPGRAPATRGNLPVAAMPARRAGARAAGAAGDAVPRGESAGPVLTWRAGRADRSRPRPA